MKAITHEKMLKAQAEAEKLKKLNQGATDFMKNMKKELDRAKLKKGIQEFNINTQAG